MGKPKGKTPSLLAVTTGTPVPHTCGKATPCDRCGDAVVKGESCFRIPRRQSGFTHYPIFCIGCTVAIVEQTKIELLAVERHLRPTR